MVRRVLLFFAFCLLGLTSAFVGLAAQQSSPQTGNGQQQGWFLIARRKVADPLFAKSTVLMLPVATFPLGLIVNKPTKMKLSELFPHARSVKKQNVTAYFGGPVDIHSMSAIFRSPAAPKHAFRIFADVYVTFDSKSVNDLVKKSKQPSELRIFLGRSQWSEPQLEHEMAIGAWYSTRDDAGPIFASDPGKIWQRLFDRLAPRPYIDYHPPQAAPSIDPPTI